MRDVASRQCRWIEVEPSRDAVCCGDITHKGSSWCNKHYARAFRAPPPRTKAQLGSGIFVPFTGSQKKY